jgi:hypothetical protein
MSDPSKHLALVCKVEVTMTSNSSGHVPRSLSFQLPPPMKIRDVLVLCSIGSDFRRGQGSSESESNSAGYAAKHVRLLGFRHITTAELKKGARTKLAWARLKLPLDYLGERSLAALERSGFVASLLGCTEQHFQVASTNAIAASSSLPASSYPAPRTLAQVALGATSEATGADDNPIGIGIDECFHSRMMHEPRM